MNQYIKTQIDLERAVQINDGLTQTSADGVGMVFDSKYGIMFCVYMPGPQGAYGESRGRISVGYFPASQPTNLRTVDIVSGNTEYCPNMIGLGDGKVRVLYEKDSRGQGDHYLCYKDFDYLSGTLSEEKIIMLHKGDDTQVPLTESEQFAYLEAHGYFEHTFLHTEQIAIGGHTIFKGEDGYWYGAITSFLSEVILYRSKDDMASVEFWAIYPRPAQYEFDYKFLNGKIYAIYRTNLDSDCIQFVSSEDNGKTWTEPVAFKDSIQCRPRMIVYHDSILMACNYYNADTGHRPEIQQGRTSVRIYYGIEADPNENIVVADLYSKYGIVNICLIDILNDVYLAFSTSQLALEYHNGNPKVRGKDAVRYIKLGDLIPKEKE